MDDPTDPLLGPPFMVHKIVETTSSKPLKVPPKKRTRHKKSKKPKDMPRRPLSAYNIFFKEERSRLLREIEDGNDVLGTEGKSQGLFALMGKSIAKKWKSLSKEEMIKYTDAAKEDLKRYRNEMDAYQILVTQKCRSDDEQKLEELDFDLKPASAASMGVQQQHQGMLAMDDPQAYGRLRELQLREASHQTDVSRLLAAGRPDLASQLVMGAGFGAGMMGQNSMIFNPMQGMQLPFRGGDIAKQQQQQPAGLGGDAATNNNKSAMELSQQLGLSGPQLLQYLQEDALRRQIERERQFQFEMLLRQQQLPGNGGSGLPNDPAAFMMMQQRAAAGAFGGGMAGPGGGLQNQQLQLLMMQQQLQQQQQQLGQFGMGVQPQQREQEHQMVQNQQQQMQQQQQQMNPIGSSADDQIGRPLEESDQSVKDDDDDDGGDEEDDFAEDL